MKSLLFTTACALAVSTVSAGLGMGACPAVSSVAYSSDMQTTRKHNLLYIDKSAFGYMKMAKKFVSAIPDVSCLALGEFPYPDQTTYDDLYVTPTGLLSFKMIHYDVDTLSEVQYACFDSATSILRSSSQTPQASLHPRLPLSPLGYRLSSPSSHGSSSPCSTEPHAFEFVYISQINQIQVFSLYIPFTHN
ncbi:hypothetical protein FGO68_gene11219 [Halteria grandinella]|uniref:Uncharacterized protein n=1 Tax=Halteria grandinella TaxID=5974 RepID=A0A8J8NKD8_HALGN|nr:hypothetical protein FGO68_gene11219 [Halteria grandinella]